MTDLTLDAYRSLSFKNVQETLRKERAKIFTAMTTDESLDLRVLRIENRQLVNPKRRALKRGSKTIPIKERIHVETKRNHHQ